MKKKNRLKKWLIGIGCFLVLLLASAYFGINYAADKMMDKLSDSILESALSTPAPTEVTEELSASPAPTTSASPSASAKDVDAGEPDQPVSNRADTDDAESSASSSTTNGNANNQSSSSSTKDSDYSYSAEVSVDKAVAVKEDITFAEKTKLMTIMLKRLSASDIKTLSDLAGGGLSVEKKVEAKKIILEKLSEKEYDELIKIAQKYGLSQGKTYEDSTRDQGIQK